MSNEKSAPAGYVMVPVELLERIDETAICDGTEACINDDLFNELIALLAAAPKAEPQPVSDDVRDAARYRWLRERVNVDKWGVCLPRGHVKFYPNKTDRAIDAAMESK